jgi:uncharacterized repeat protein (TIGR03803 family)
MRCKKLSIGLRATVAIFTVSLFVTSTWAATETVLHAFDPNLKDGDSPVATLIFDAAGNIYGTTSSGGAFGKGTVFELTPQAGGGWTENVLYSFGNGTDGAGPSVSGLIFDAAGNLYGTTYGGGIYRAGTVFELTPQAGGGWTENVLYSFGNGTDGADPQASLIFDAAGNLYGTTGYGGTHGLGTVFELTPKPGGGWKEKVLHNFKKADGFRPHGLIFDAAGNLYGTTVLGGGHNKGTVFEMMPQAGGGWMLQVLHSFSKYLPDGTYDGLTPYASLIFDGTGSLYGTTQDGGAHGCGTVFELVPQADGGWTENVLHDFGNDTDGAYPQSNLIFDAAGNLYGTTYIGGAYGLGTVFELTPQADGGWMESVLYDFSGGTDGSVPIGGLIFDAAGNLYGTTSRGGVCPNNCGTVFELSP